MPGVEEETITRTRRGDRRGALKETDGEQGGEHIPITVAGLSPRAAVSGGRRTGVVGGSLLPMTEEGDSEKPVSGMKLPGEKEPAQDGHSR